MRTTIPWYFTGCGKGQTKVWLYNVMILCSFSATILHDIVYNGFMIDEMKDFSQVIHNCGLKKKKKAWTSELFSFIASSAKTLGPISSTHPFLTPRKRGLRYLYLIYEIKKAEFLVIIQGIRTYVLSQRSSIEVLKKCFIKSSYQYSSLKWGK